MAMRILYIYILITSFIYAGLNKPSAGENLRYIHILFEWDQEPDAISYNLQSSSSTSFNNLILNIELDNTSYIATTNFNWDSDYYWRVQPVYSNGSTGPWMDSYFSTEDTELSSLELDDYDIYEVWQKLQKMEGNKC